MKKLTSCILVLLLMLSFASSALAMSYSGTASDGLYFSTGKYTKINDTTLQDSNTHCRKNTSTGAKTYYDSRFRIVLSDESGTVYYTESQVYSGGGHVETNSDQGRCTLQIVNNGYAGTTIHAKGYFFIL